MATPSFPIRFRIGVALLLAAFLGLPSLALASDMTGTWQLETSLSDSAKNVPWYERKETLVIRQTATELVIERVGDLPMTYRLDGEVHLYDEGGSDVSPEYRRKVRTQLIRLGPALVVRTTPVREDVDMGSGRVTRVQGVTTTEVYTLSADGKSLTVVRSGQRRTTPETLHGLPYRPEQDPLVRRSMDVFLKATP
jgi:hypothetical protein